MIRQPLVTSTHTDIAVAVCAGGGPLLAALGKHFDASGDRPDPRSGAFGETVSVLAATSLVLPAFQMAPQTYQAAAAEAYVLVDAIRLFEKATGRLPRHVVVLHARGENALLQAGGAILRTLVNYTTSHKMFHPISVNLVRYLPTNQGLRRAADAAAALTSGLIDHMRGQALDLVDLPEALP